METYVESLSQSGGEIFWYRNYNDPTSKAAIIPEMVKFTGQYG